SGTRRRGARRPPIAGDRGPPAPDLRLSPAGVLSTRVDYVAAAPARRALGLEARAAWIQSDGPTNRIRQAAARDSPLPRGCASRHPQDRTPETARPGRRLCVSPTAAWT